MLNKVLKLLFLVVTIVVIFIGLKIILRDKKENINRKNENIFGGTMIESSNEDTYKGIVYLDPTNISTICNEKNSSVGSGTKGCMKFYIYDDDGDKYKLILDHNTENGVAWDKKNINVDYSKSGVYKSIKKLKWDESLNTSVISTSEINKITGKTNFDVNSYDAWYYFDNPNKESNQTLIGQGTSKYFWLYDYLNECTDYGCNSSALGYGNYAYWTHDTLGKTGETCGAWLVYKFGYLYYDAVDDHNYGVRPVITILKSHIKDDSKKKKEIIKNENLEADSDFGGTKIEALEGETHKGIVYLDPTNISAICNEKNSSVGSGTKGCMKFYIYDDEEDKYKLILDHNTESKIIWDSNSNVVYELSGAYKSIENLNWDDSLDTSIISVEEINKITEKKDFDVSSYDAWYYFDDPNKGQIQTAIGQATSKYSWLYDYLDECTNYGCNSNTASSILGDYGYITRNPFGIANSNTLVWHVYRYGRLLYNNVYNASSGVRPVITISKTIINRGN